MYFVVVPQWLNYPDCTSNLIYWVVQSFYQYYKREIFRDESREVSKAASGKNQNGTQLKISAVKLPSCGIATVSFSLESGSLSSALLVTNSFSIQK